MKKQMGLIPLAETIFPLPMVITAVVVLVTLPLLNAMLHPKPGQPYTEIWPCTALLRAHQSRCGGRGRRHVRCEAQQQPDLCHGNRRTGMAYVVVHFVRGGGADPNLINFFAPSGGGHWMIQGPFMIDAANAIGASPAQTAMSVMLGNVWNDLVQPSWILPALALSKLKLKDIMGYTVIMMFWVGIIYIAAILLWGYLS